MGRWFYYEDARWPWRPDDFLRRFLKKPKRERAANASKPKALDVGMGYGRNSLWLAEQGYEVEGWELNGSYVREARREAHRRGLRLQARQVDFSKRPITGTYDLIVISQVLHQERHSVGSRALRQARKALAPGGQLFLLAKLSRDRYFLRLRTDANWKRMPGERNTWRRLRLPRKREWGRLSWPRGGGKDWVMSALTLGEIRAALRGLRLRHCREVILQSDWEEDALVTHHVAEVVAVRP